MKRSRPDPHAPPELHLIAADGGVVAPPAVELTLISRWMTSMVVVEALCPRWPERECFTGQEKFKLRLKRSGQRRYTLWP